MELAVAPCPWRSWPVVRGSRLSVGVERLAVEKKLGRSPYVVDNTGRLPTRTGQFQWGRICTVVVSGPTVLRYR
jgi:hypothetical protein